MKAAREIPQTQKKASSEGFHLTNADVAALNAGAASFKAGRVKPWEDVKAGLRAKLEDAKKNSQRNE